MLRDTQHAIRPHLPPLALWTVLWGLFFGTILLGWERLPNSDLTGQFDAFARHQAREMLAGRLPLWSEGSFGGIPFVADVQAAVFYLPRWVTVFASAPWGFSYYALQLEALLHVWCLGVFVYFLAYDIGAGGRVDHARWGALVPAVMVGLGGYVTSYPLLQLAVLETYTWLPLVLLLIRKGTAGSRDTSRFSLLTGLVLALAFTAGHPQTFLHISYVAAFYYLFRTWQASWAWLKILGYGLLIGTVAIGGSAAAWLPVVTYLPLTVRADVNYDFVSTGEAVLNYLQVVMPGMLTFWSPQFVGVGGALLAVVGWLGRKGHGSKETRGQGEVGFWGMVVVLGAWLSLGDKGVLFEGWYYVAPGFQLFRQQERLVGVVVFGVSMLAGLGMMRVDRDLLKRGGKVVGSVLVIATVVALVAPHMVAISWPLVWMWQILFLVGVFLLLWVGAHREAPLQRAWGMVGIVCWIAAELYVGTFAGVNRTAGPPNVIWPEPEWLEVLREEPELGRVDPGFLFFVNMGEAYDLESVRGITPLKPQVLEDMEGRLILSRLWPLLNVTHGVFVGKAPDDVAATKVADVDESLIPGEAIVAGLYRFDEARPRVWLSTRPVVVADDAAALGAIAAPEFDPAVQVVVLEETAALYTVEPTDNAGTVEINRPRDGLLDIMIDTPSAAYVVISEWHMEGWEATLNGQVESLHKVDYGLQGVFVPAGSHRLTLEFAPQSVTTGIIMSIMTLLAALGWLVFEWRRKGAG